MKIIMSARTVLAIALLLLAPILFLGMNPASGESDAAAGTIKMTFAPVADAYVSNANPNKNYGATLNLEADASPIIRTYMRFNIHGVVGTIRSAQLRVYAVSGSPVGYDLRLVTDNNWQETAITYANAPAVGPVRASSVPFNAGVWVSVGVKPLVGGNGKWSVALTTRARNVVKFASRQLGAYAPQLVVVVSPSVSTPTPTKRPTQTLTPTVTPTPILTGNYARPFNPDSIWNKPIASSGQSVAGNSAQTIGIIASLYGGSNVPIILSGVDESWSVPVYFANSATPKRNVCGLMTDGTLVYCTYGLFPVGSGFYPSWDDGSSSTDNKIAVIDTSTNRGWSAWQFRPYNKNGIDYTAGLAAYGWTDVSTSGDGITMHDGGAWGGRTAGLSYLGGLIWPDEIQQGHIDHALAFAVDPRSVSNSLIWWPARHGDGSSGDPNALPIGARIQLDPAFDLNTLPSGAPRIIAKALQVYGAWLVDTGGSFSFDGREFVGTNGVGVDRAPWQAVGVSSSYILRGSIPWSSFRVLTQASPSNFYLHP
jgi:hypothetical protein